MKHILPILGLLFVTIPLGHYSTFSFILACTTLASKNYIYYPFMITNSFGVLGTWYSACFYWDRTLIKRMMDRFNWSPTKYVFGDFVLHVIPFATCMYLLFDESTYKNVAPFSNEAIVRHCGLFSIFVNMTWALISQMSFDLKEAYVPQAYNTWNSIWFCAFLSHMIPMFVWTFKFEKITQTIQLNHQQPPQ